MNARYRKPRVRVGPGASGAVGGVVGEVALTGLVMKQGPRPVQRKAKARQKIYSDAERRLEHVLNAVGNGVLRGKWHREWAFGPWIVDYFLWEIRLAIEVDGPSHASPRQKQRDRLKDADLEQAGITVMRLSNEQVLGNQEKLVKFLRFGYRVALDRQRESNGPHTKASSKNAPTHP